MPRRRTPMTLLAAAALALSVTACGSESPDDTAARPTASASSTGPDTSESATPGNSGIVPDNTWAGVFKKAVPPLADRSDEEVVAAAKKVCSTFEATPDKPTAKAILADLGTTLNLDATQQQIFASGAVTHFCTAQSGAWTQASIG
ncbi:DUF732 domain-containing protein [Knoellia sp. CPCC 206450]|uniref:DUF732 domain-containing protein n=1 Tax=Knoellia tibetensis TaxID=3404798 RepID=UPI003B434343